MSAKTLGISLVIGAALGKGYFSVFDNAEKRAAKLGSALQENNKKLNAGKAVIAYQNKLKSLQQFQGNLGQSSDKMKRRIAAVGLELETAKRKAKAYGLSIGDVVKEQRKLSIESKRLEINIKRLGKAEAAKQKLGAIRGRVLGAAGLAFGASRLVGNAFNVERKVLRLKTVINDKGDAKAIEKSVAHSIEFARHSLASQENILDIEYSLNSAGLSASAARAGSEIVSKLTDVTGGVSEEVGVIVGDSFQNFQNSMTGTAKDKLSRIGNILLKTQEKFSIKNFGQLGESIKEGASAAIGAKIPFEQMAAAVGQLNSAGLKGTQAGTSFKALVGQLILKQDKLGISIVKTANGSTDFIATMKQLKNKMGTVGGATEQLAFLQSTLGQQGADAAILLLNNMDALGKGYDFVASKNNKLDEDYKGFVNSASGQWKMFNQNISLVGTTLAGTLLPALNSILTPIASIAGWVVGMVQKFPVLGKILGAVTAGAVIYGVVLTGVVVAQWAYNSAAIATSNSLITSGATLLWSKAILVGTTIATTALTAAQWAWNIALNANPIGLVIAGVVAFGALAVTVYKNWEPIKTFFADLWGGITKGADTALNFVGDKFNSVKSFFGLGNSPASTGKKSGAVKAAALGVAIAAPTASLPATAAPASQQSQVVNNQQYHINVTQHAGESSEALARRITEIQQENSLRNETDVR